MSLDEWNDFRVYCALSFSEYALRRNDLLAGEYFREFLPFVHPLSSLLFPLFFFLENMPETCQGCVVGNIEGGRISSLACI